jgi:hypothetical protein
VTAESVTGYLAGSALQQSVRTICPGHDRTNIQLYCRPAGFSYKYRSRSEKAA